METHKKQHYIPECYLKNFSFDDKGIFVYRKNQQNNVFKQSISNIACEKKFYDIDATFLDNNHLEKTKYIEKEVFANGFEPIFANLLDKIINICHKWSFEKPLEILTEKERDYFAELIAVQYLRMPNFRKKYWNANKEIYVKRSAIVQAFLSLEKPEFKKASIDLNFDEKYASAFHSDFILNDEFRHMIQEQLVKKVWIYAYTDKNLHTSDNPILKKPHLPNKESFVEGFGMSGVEIIFPISNNLLLTIWDEEYFSELLPLNNTVTEIDDKRLREYNSYQYCFAEHEVYSLSDDFDIIKVFKQLNDGKDYIGIKNQIKTN